MFVEPERSLEFLSSLCDEFPHLTCLSWSSFRPTEALWTGVNEVQAHALADPSLFPVSNLAGQHPIAFEDKQTLLGRPLHAQPEKRVTSAMSDAGAALVSMHNLKKNIKQIYLHKTIYYTQVKRH